VRRPYQLSSTQGKELGRKGSFAIGTAKMDNSITIIVSENPQEYRWKATTMLDGIRDLLGENINHTSTKSLMANPTDPFFCDRDMPRPRCLHVTTLANQELRLCLDTLRLLQVGHNFGLIENRSCRPHATLEIELQFLDRQCFRDQFKSRVWRKAGSMFCEHLQRGPISWFVPMRR
jgi:hypothetical protein